MQKNQAKNLIPHEAIQSKIIVLRGRKVMIDRDLAMLYEIKPIAMRQQVKRNMERFPNDFMFQLTDEETNILISQNVIPSKQSLGGYLPFVFTENGVAMLSSVLRSKKAININIQIMRAFLRELQKDEEVEIDFDGVITFTPSWGDEFLSPLLDEFGGRVILKNTENASVQATLELLESIHKKKFRRE